MTVPILSAADKYALSMDNKPRDRLPWKAKEKSITATSSILNRGPKKKKRVNSTTVPESLSTHA